MSAQATRPNKVPSWVDACVNMVLISMAIGLGLFGAGILCRLVFEVMRWGWRAVDVLAN